MIAITSLQMTCSACPSQWEGRTADGRSVYIRYRHGNLTVDLNGETVLSKSVGDAYAGVMNTTELAAAIAPRFLIAVNP